MRKWLAFLLPAVILLAGCSPAPVTQAPSPVVTQITVEGEYEEAALYRQYQNTDKIRQVLLYLRALRPQHSAGVDVESLDVPEVRIVMTYRDGAMKQYRLKAVQYFQEGDEPWKKVNVDKAAKLCQVIRDMPSD